MKRYRGYGAIGMLITLVIIGILFVLLIPTIKGTNSSFGIFDNSLNTQNIETSVENKIKNIENLRLQQKEEINKFYQGY